MITQQTVLSLVKASLNNTPAIIPSGFTLNEYLTFARKQQIEALVITGSLKSGIMVSRKEKNILPQSVLLSNQQIAVAERLYALFRTHKIDYMPLKGCVLRFLYPSDALRSMGDIDILIQKTQYKQIRRLLLKEGFREGCETDHEYVWDWHGIHIELHKRLIPDRKSVV